MSKHFKIITKEVGRDNPIETEFVGDVDRAYLIKFFGLREPDVEWFRIEEIQKDWFRDPLKTTRAAAVRLLVVWIVVFQRTDIRELHNQQTVPVVDPEVGSVEQLTLWKISTDSSVILEIIIAPFLVVTNDNSSYQESPRYVNDPI